MRSERQAGVQLEDVLAELARNQIAVWSEHENLRYRAPAGALSDALRATLTEHKAALLPFIPALGNELAHSQAEAEPEPITGPLSAAQRVQWALYQTTPTSSVAHVGLALRLSGRLDHAALNAALHSLVRRHPTLRTTYANSARGPVQRLQTTAWADSRELLTRQRALGADHVELAREHARPFDLEREPALRAVLFELGQHEYVLLLTLHHIAADGWSLWILVDQLRQTYAALRLGDTATAPSAGQTYLGLAACAAREPSSSRADLHAYWVQQLSGAPFVLELPGERPRPASFRNVGACYTFQVTAPLTRRLAALARAHGATLYALLLAAYQLLLSRYSGETDLLVGCPVFGRDGAGLDQLVGDFVNVVPVRAELNDDPSFVTWLERVRERLLGALAHSACPLPEIIEQLQVARDARRPALVQACFAMQTPQLGRDLIEATLAGTSAPFADLQASCLPLDQQAGNFDLTLDVVDLGRAGPHGLHCTLKYNTDIYGSASAQRLATGLLRLLAAIADQPEARVSELAVSDPDEWQRVMSGLNATTRDYPQKTPVHELVAEQARRTPDAVAIEWGTRSLTYAQLVDSAQSLAKRLRRLGVGPEVRVATCLERSPELIVAFLGTLAAGGAYVPLDPSYPSARLQYMIADSRAAVLLTDREHADRVPAATEHACEVVMLDVPEHSGQDHGRHEQQLPALSSDSLAYIIYTSGSTGRPKGVMVTHRAINRLCFDLELAPIQPEHRVPQASNASFDAATFEIWAPLVHGGCVVGLDKQTLLSPARLARFLVEARITTMFVVPTIFNQTLREHPRAFATLHTLLVGGEVLDPRWMHHLLEHGAPQRLINVYGPTECTTFATWHLVERVRQGVDGTLANIPIGRPIANTQAFVLDAHMKPVPLGAPGQLYLGGDGLSRGYFDRPELTRSRFVDSPFDANQRLYATGDLVRLMAEGTLEFLGRLDDQVKVRGVRIELGEIESAICAIPSVTQGRVVLREDRPGEPRLVAYVVPKADAPVLTLAQLHQLLQQRLPSSMLPAALVLLDAIPLSVNGKLDRARLPAPDLNAGAAASDAPRTPLERRVAEVWSRVLGGTQSALGRDASFFEVGGDSITIIQLHGELCAVLGIEMPVVELFRRPTIASFAEWLTDRQGAQSRSDDSASVQTARLREGQSRRREQLRRRANTNTDR